MPHPEDDLPLLVYTTLANESDAQSLVQHLVTCRLIACGTIIPGARSVYRWNGEVISGAEALVILKSRYGRWDELLAEVQQKHPYDIPELIAVPAMIALPAYIRWIVEETTPIDAETT